MKNTKISLALVAVAFLSACNQQGGQAGSGIMSGGSVNKQDVGTLAGAIGGGVIGHNIGKGSGQTVATIAGTLLGGAIGNSIGGSLDAADRAAYNSTSQQALNDVNPGQTLPWKNQQTGNYGSVTPLKPYQNPNGQYCREFDQTIVVGGKKQSGHGTACREPDGTWKIIQ